MGRKRKRNEKENGGKRKRLNESGQEGGDGRSGQVQPYAEAETEPVEDFVNFYKEVGFCKDEAEWNRFLEVAKSHLPITFRIAQTSAFHKLLRYMMQEVFSPKLKGVVTAEGQVVAPPTPLPWYPEELAWHWDMGRSQLRKIKKEEGVKDFFQFLVSMSDMGYFTRQETVSMIPPFFLGVQSHHRVLDMCAAPGSKTTQLIEYLHHDQRVNGGPPPTGVVVANDVDYKRTHMLVHQISRLHSPAAVVTRLGAQTFPLLKYTKVGAGGAKEKAVFQFDRILCDVPCTGDGTTRKNPDVWTKWTPYNAYSLHKLQLRIAQRGARLLRPGGRMVYSTCSMNPVENEAVVAALLRSRPYLRLVDVSDTIPQLARVPGMTTWNLVEHGEVLESYESLRPRRKDKVPESAFAPANGAELHLERCVRVYHHMQNTGGFFIATLEKVAGESAAEVEDEDENASVADAGPSSGPPRASGPELDASAPAAATGGVTSEKDVVIKADKGDAVKAEKVDAAMEDSAPSNFKVVKGDKRFPDPYQIEGLDLDQDYFIPGSRDENLFMPLAGSWEDSWHACQEMYGFRVSEEERCKYLVRTVDNGNCIYAVSEGLVEFLRANSLTNKCRLVNCGVKVFVKKGHKATDTYSGYRLASSGTELTAKLLTKHRMKISRGTLSRLIAQEHLNEADLPEAEQAAIAKIGDGPMLLEVDLASNFVSCPLFCTSWRTKDGVKHQISKQEVKSILVLLQTLSDVEKLPDS